MIANATPISSRKLHDPLSREEAEGKPRPPSWAVHISGYPWWNAPQAIADRWPVQLRGLAHLVEFLSGPGADRVDLDGIAAARASAKNLASASRARYADNRAYRRAIDAEDQGLLDLVAAFNVALARHRERVLHEWEAIRPESMRPPVHDLSPTASH